MHLRSAFSLPRIFIFLFPVVVWAQQAAVVAEVQPGVLKLEPYKVSGAGVSANTAAGTEATEVFTERDLAESNVFDVGEFFSQLAASPAGTEQLVLINGKPTYMDVSKLPPEMIASIEVSNYGALPQYGAYANGRVINIRLKTSYRGESLGLVFRGAFEGEGFQSGVSLSGAVVRNKLRFVYSVGYKKQEALLASDRVFSRNQDHTFLGGQDLRLLWGETAVVRAVSGNLAGFLDANGQPTSVALVPENQNGRGLTAGNFLSPQIFPPATEATAAGQRRFNTAEYRTLIAPFEEKSATFEISRPFGERIEASLSGSVTDKDATRSQAPSVTGVSGDTVVPAAYNPFGQDVQIGMVHAGFGPVLQRDSGTAVQLGLNLNGRWADTWRWNATLGGRWNRATQHVTDLDRDKFSASLAAADPAQRFNPFGDDPRNAELYPALTVVRSSQSQSDAARLDLSTHGDLFKLKGGPVRLVVNGNYNQQVRTKTYENQVRPDVGETRRRDNGQGATASLNLPWVGETNARSWVRRLENQLTVGYSSRSSSQGGTLNGRFGLRWSPHRALSLRGNYSLTERAPSRFVAEVQPLVGETLIDPQRFPATAADVQLVERDFDGTVRARGESLMLGATVEPPLVPGLEISFIYDRQQQHRLTGSVFKPQDLIYNEFTFPGRVVRAAPSEDDLRLGQPGQIISIDTTPSDDAEQEASGLALSLRYRRKTEHHGLFLLTTSLRHPLSRRYEVLPGIPFVFESGNDLNPPDWTMMSHLSWNWSGWRIRVNFQFVDQVVSGALVQPATKELSLQLGYRFSKAIWGKWGRGLQVAVGLGDLLEGSPPYADTINGFRSGSALGRTYSLTMRIPLGSSKESEVD